MEPGSKGHLSALEEEANGEGDRSRYVAFSPTFGTLTLRMALETALQVSGPDADPPLRFDALVVEDETRDGRLGLALRAAALQAERARRSREAFRRPDRMAAWRRRARPVHRPQHDRGPRRQPLARGLDLGRPYLGAQAPDGRCAVTARALVIEDDPASRRLTGATAKAHGVEGLLLHGPDTALPLAEPRRFQLGLFDYHMPGCDGLAPLQRMRASPGGAPGRCILLTADGTAATRQFVGPGLFDEVLLKPIPVARLSGILTALRTNA